jgi:hypothetical protein
MKLKIYRPSRNLGCLGFRWGRFYIDFFRRPFWGFFYTNGKDKRIKRPLFRTRCPNCKRKTRRLQYVRWGKAVRVGCPKC